MPNFASIGRVDLVDYWSSFILQINRVQIQCHITHFIKLGSPRQTLPWLCPANPMLEFANPESGLTPHILCIIHHQPLSIPPIATQ